MSEQPYSNEVSSLTFDVIPVVISKYAYHPELEEVEEYSNQIADLFSELGGTLKPWPLTHSGRDQTRISTWLADWADPPETRSSVVVWLGHGQALGNEAWLAAHDTRSPMRGTGISPRKICEHLVNEWRRRAFDDDAWTLLVVEACGAETFVRLLAAALLEQDRTAVPERLALIGVGGRGTNYLGAFRDALVATIESFTDNDREIRLKDLIGRLEDRLPQCRVVQFGVHDAPPLRRTQSPPRAVAAPLDVYGELRAFLRQLPVDVRSHFLPKAQGAEHGELAWYFVGRDVERLTIARWLATSKSGMLIVTGPAGAGKSALLGNILIHTNPKLRDVLVRSNSFDDLSGDERPPADAFDAIVHLTGLTTVDLVERIASAASVELPATERKGDVDWLLSQLGRRSFTLLVDALDEAQDPASIASSVLRRIAALPQGRVVVGTRASVSDRPDQPRTASQDLLGALGRSTTTQVVHVDRDRDAVETYVWRRLTAATNESKIDAGDAVTHSIATEVAGQDRQFLYARLVVHEILARPSLLRRENRSELSNLLNRDHSAIFAAAVTRLTAVAAVNHPLLEALALARGRGLPRADRVWAAVATVLGGGRQVTENDIDALLQNAAPYIMLDAEDGQSVYRLAHWTFREFFEARVNNRGRAGDYVARE